MEALLAGRRRDSKGSGGGKWTPCWRISCWKTRNTQHLKKDLKEDCIKIYQQGVIYMFVCVTAAAGLYLLQGRRGEGWMSHNARVNYVHYGHTTDSSSIEVNQLQQIKGEWRSHRPLLPLNPLLHTVRRRASHRPTMTWMVRVMWLTDVHICKTGWKKWLLCVRVSHLTMSMAW